MSKCCICNKDVSQGKYLTHRRCEHKTHHQCLADHSKKLGRTDESQFMYSKCALCLGEIKSTSSARVMNSTGGGGGADARPPDNIDYVLNPGAPRAFVGRRLFTQVGAALGLAARETIETTQDPYVLLSADEKVEISDIRTRNKLGMQHFLKDGIRIGNLVPRYTWDELKEFDELNPKRKLRSKQTLVALGVTANHFRDYADFLPYPQIKEELGLSTRDLRDSFQLYFPSATEPLQCKGSADWNALDCLQMGINADDLTVLGLSTASQYRALMDGLSAPQIADAERSLGMTAEHIQRLVENEQQQFQVVEDEQYVPVAQEVAAPPPAPQQIMVAPPVLEEDDFALDDLPPTAAKKPTITNYEKPLYVRRAEFRTRDHGAII
jgi:hypothetical protein